MADDPDKAKRHRRPTVLTPELQEGIIAALNAGCYLEPAAARVGVSKNTLYDWVRRGVREKTGMYAEFSDAVEKAMAAAETAGIARIRQAAGEDWRAMAWWLERRYQTKWGRKSAIKVTDFGETPDEQSAAIMAKTASGELSVEDATSLMNLIQSRVKILESSELFKKLEELEAKIQELVAVRK